MSRIRVLRCAFTLALAGTFQTDLPAFTGTVSYKFEVSTAQRVVIGWSNLPTQEADRFRYPVETSINQKRKILVYVFCCERLSRRTPRGGGV